MNLLVPRSGQVFDPSLDPPPMWRKAKPLRGLVYVKSCIQAVIQILLPVYWTIQAGGRRGRFREESDEESSRISDRDVPLGEDTIITEERLQRLPIVPSLLRLPGEQGFFS